MCLSTALPLPRLGRWAPTDLPVQVVLGGWRCHPGSLWAWEEIHIRCWQLQLEAIAVRVGGGGPYGGDHQPPWAHKTMCRGGLLGSRMSQPPKSIQVFLFLAITDAHIDLGLPDAFLRDPDRIWFRAHLLSLRWLTLRTWLLPDQTQANGDALLLDQSQHQPAEVHGHWQRVSREGVGTYPLGFATFHPDLLGLGLTYHYSHSVSLQTGGSTATKQVGKCWQDWYHDVGRCLSGPTIDHVLNWYRIPLWNKNRNTGGLDSNFLKVFGWATQRSSQFGKATVWVCWVLGGAQRPNAARQNATRNACQSVLPYRSTNNLPQYRCRWRNMDRSTNNLPQYTCRWRNIFIYIYTYIIMEAAISTRVQY